MEKEHIHYEIKQWDWRAKYWTKWGDAIAEATVQKEENLNSASSFLKNLS